MNKNEITDYRRSVGIRSLATVHPQTRRKGLLYGVEILQETVVIKRRDFRRNTATTAAGFAFARNFSLLVSAQVNGGVHFRFPAASVVKLEIELA